MKYTTLPNTDVKVSKICLGTMTFGQQNTEAEGHAQMDYALEKGINFFDTAEMYSIPSRMETYGSTSHIQRIICAEWKAVPKIFRLQPCILLHCKIACNLRSFMDQKFIRT